MLGAKPEARSNIGAPHLLNDAREGVDARSKHHKGRRAHWDQGKLCHEFRAGVVRKSKHREEHEVAVRSGDHGIYDKQQNPSPWDGWNVCGKSQHTALKPS